MTAFWNSGINSNVMFDIANKISNEHKVDYLRFRL